VFFYFGIDKENKMRYSYLSGVITGKEKRGNGGKHDNDGCGECNRCVVRRVYPSLRCAMLSQRYASMANGQTLSIVEATIGLDLEKDTWCS
jgi:hypothetical protein